jgi:hypothetical protein
MSERKGRGDGGPVVAGDAGEDDNLQPDNLLDDEAEEAALIDAGLDEHKSNAEHVSRPLRSSVSQRKRNGLIIHLFCAAGTQARQ